MSGVNSEASPGIPVCSPGKRKWRERRGDNQAGREAERRWMADVGEKRETPRRKMTEKTVRGFRSAAKS